MAKYISGKKSKRLIAEEQKKKQGLLTVASRTFDIKEETPVMKIGPGYEDDVIEKQSSEAIVVEMNQLSRSAFCENEAFSRFLSNQGICPTKILHAENGWRTCKSEFF